MQQLAALRPLRYDLSIAARCHSLICVSAVRAVYLNGQILGASGFPGGNQGLHCEWALITESNWQKVQGLDKASAQSLPARAAAS